jgi:hypothetical protein
MRQDQDEAVGLALVRESARGEGRREIDIDVAPLDRDPTPSAAIEKGKLDYKFVRWARRLATPATGRVACKPIASRTLMAVYARRSLLRAELGLSDRRRGRM